METIQRMYDHLHWANERILEALKSNENEESIRLFSHILFAEKVWFTRLQGLDSSHLPIWSDIDLDSCAELIKENQKTITKFLQSADLDSIISYKNSKGTEFKNSVRDVLTHVALHGQYHRGQINTRLRTSGFEPVNVDYITFVR